MRNSNLMLKKYQDFATAMVDVQKSVTIEICENDLKILKQNKYKLCFAKKVGENDYNVVWQSYTDYLSNNAFSWIPKYQLFGSNEFEANVTVKVSTNKVDIGLGETALLDASGYLESAYSGGPDISITLSNEYGPIHPGLNQISTGIDGEEISTPIYVGESQVVEGDTKLTPVEKVLVWFEQNVETSMMFSTSRSKAVEIDLTSTNTATREYCKGKWITPSGGKTIVGTSGEVKSDRK